MPGHFTFYCNRMEGNLAYFDEVESKHAIQVLRYGLGDEIQFTNGQGMRMKGVIEMANKQGFQASVTQTEAVERPSELHILMAILKAGDRMEWACEKITELGVSSFTLFQSDHGERAKVNMERMKKVVLSAMKQSHGSWLPTVEVLPFQEAIKSHPHIKQKYIAHCGVGDKVSMLEVLTPSAVMIGPEGDFSQNEVESAERAGWLPLNLGEQILRTETAAVAVAAALRLR